MTSGLLPQVGFLGLVGGSVKFLEIAQFSKSLLESFLSFVKFEV